MCLAAGAEGPAGVAILGVATLGVESRPRPAAR
jgi:hypothetical protein